MATTTEAVATKPKVTLYWLDQSRSQRIVWLLEECKIPYDIKVFKRGSDMLAPAELKKIHPIGKAPIIGVHKDDGTELILAESGFMVEYLTEHWAPHLIPDKFAEGKSGPGNETESWLRYRYYMHYAEGSLMALLVTNLIFDTLKGPKTPFYVRPLMRAVCDRVDQAYFSPNFKTHFSFLESQLASSPDDGLYLCGSKLTAADILMSFPVIAAKAAGYIEKETYPKLFAYVESIEAMEGQQSSVKKIEEVTGEPYKPLTR